MAHPEKVHFRGLNELRVLAALAVILSHIEDYKHAEGMSSLFDTPLEPLVAHLGKNAVNLFFVLSGFLITYLLLVEKQAIGSVDVRKFYLRRILRIWPLYYLVVGYSLFLIPALQSQTNFMAGESYWPALIAQVPERFALKLSLFLLILPNVVLSLGYIVVGAAQSWSIGVEEQFYYLWPWVMRWFTWKRAWMLCLIFPAKRAVLVALVILGKKSESWLLHFLAQWVLEFKIELMTLGGLGAILLYYHRERVVMFVTDRRVGILIVGGIFGLLSYRFDVCLGLFFCLLILSSTQTGGIGLRNGPLDYIGRISYGVYMYHPLVMCLSFPFARSLGIENVAAFNAVIYPLVIGGTLFISHLSFVYFESWFVALKHRVAVVETSSG